MVVLDNFSTGYRVNVESLGGAETVDGDVRDGELVARLVQTPTSSSTSLRASATAARSPIRSTMRR